MLMFFYEHEGGKYRPLIEKYFDDLISGKTAKQAFEADFKDKAADLQREWTDFVKKLKP